MYVDTVTRNVTPCPRRHARYGAVMMRAANGHAICCYYYYDDIMRMRCFCRQMVMIMICREFMLLPMMLLPIRHDERYYALRYAFAMQRHMPLCHTAICVSAALHTYFACYAYFARCFRCY